MYEYGAHIDAPDAPVQLARVEQTEMAILPWCCPRPIGRELDCRLVRYLGLKCEMKLIQGNQTLRGSLLSVTNKPTKWMTTEGTQTTVTDVQCG